MLNWFYHFLLHHARMMVPIIGLMMMSLLVISSATSENSVFRLFLTPQTVKQLHYFGLGLLFFFFFSTMNYRLWKQWTWVLYWLTILALIGLFFSPPIAGVRRWYAIPKLMLTVQPAEFAKIAVILVLSLFFEKNALSRSSWSVFLQALFIVALPAYLIFKQPDLGTALTLFPLFLGIAYMAHVNQKGLFSILAITSIILLFTLALFLNFISHEALRPYATLVLKDYQYNRLIPNSYHVKRALSAISIGGIKGTGWKKSFLTHQGYLPKAHKDAVFAAFGEEFGLLGLTILLQFFYLLISHGLHASARAKDEFGRLFSIGVTCYFISHLFFNAGMMTGMLPITGIPLPLITLGGSSIIVTMSLLGIVHNIYSQEHHPQQQQYQTLY